LLSNFNIQVSTCTTDRQQLHDVPCSRLPRTRMDRGHKFLIMSLTSAPTLILPIRKIDDLVSLILKIDGDFFRVSSRRPSSALAFRRRDRLGAALLRTPASPLPPQHSLIMPPKRKGSAKGKSGPRVISEVRCAPPPFCPRLDLAGSKWLQHGGGASHGGTSCAGRRSPRTNSPVRR
jgi:hypothetical protein